jgi:hypothetical protein
MSNEKRYTPSVSLTPKEKKWLEMKADEVGVSYTRYMKEVALGKRTQAGELMGKDNRLKQILQALAPIGNNINQIAKKANETGHIYEQFFRDARQELNDLQIKILEELQ